MEVQAPGCPWQERSMRAGLTREDFLEEEGLKLPAKVEKHTEKRMVGRRLPGDGFPAAPGPA